MSTQELFNEALKELFVCTLPQMKSEQPTETDSEAQRVYQLAFEAFETGFLYGIKFAFGEQEGNICK